MCGLKAREMHMIAELKTAVTRGLELVVTNSYVYALVLMQWRLLNGSGGDHFTQWMVKFEGLKVI